MKSVFIKYNLDIDAFFGLEEIRHVDRRLQTGSNQVRALLGLREESTNKLGIYSQRSLPAYPKMSYTATMALSLFSGPVTYTFWNPPMQSTDVNSGDGFSISVLCGFTERLVRPLGRIVGVDRRDSAALRTSRIRIRVVDDEH
jgi:hypothetical protein